MKNKKRMVSVICLALGVVLLVGASFANYGNANGYQLYKESIKKMLDLTNYSADIDVSLTYDDVVMGSVWSKVQFNDEAEVTASLQAGEAEYGFDGTEQYSYDRKEFYSNNVRYEKYYNSDEWYANRTTGSGNPFKNLFGSEETTERAVRFVELLADVFVGDLKNNFALVKSEDGNDSYEINLAGGQIPEFVNAGLALVFASNNMGGSTSFVAYADDFEWSREDESAVSAVWGEAEKMRKDEGGIIVIENDRTLSRYQTYDEYKKASIKQKSDSELTFDDMLYLMGDEPTIGIASSHFTLDDEGRLLENEIVGTLVGVDDDGVEHTMGLKINIRLYDYDNTIPEALVDPSTVEVSDDPYAYAYEINGDETVEVTEVIEQVHVDTGGVDLASELAVTIESPEEDLTAEE